MSDYANSLRAATGAEIEEKTYELRLLLEKRGVRWNATKLAPSITNVDDGAKMGARAYYSADLGGFMVQSTPLTARAAAGMLAGLGADGADYEPVGEYREVPGRDGLGRPVTECSSCGKWLYDGLPQDRWPRCPHCGARVRRGES